VSARAAARARPGSARARAAAPARAAPPARARPRPAEAPARRARPAGAARGAGRAPARPRIRVGLLVIPLVALVLGGIVWVNVAKLSLTNATGQTIERARSVEAETARLKARLDQREANVMRSAQKRLGMEAPPGDAVTTLNARTP
jgi:hypothetical protein